ncbi:ParA family protein [Fibrella forsythiae]|uniref:ParA family protein n=1 Tax=Fibrella forsythiae TaxID=2817061 RepID=A0ABS3JSS6_9BACT|nr:ParA family protein [Fibrella forsythiae]MBO0953064.1 ParA family protein [Fibrella forsythiae]
MFIITIAHQKGGVGKTTLSLNLAYCLADSLRVAVADTDPQGSISSLSSMLAGIQVVDLDSVLKREVADLDAVIIDTPPYLSSRLPELFAISDYVLIPTKAGFLDAMAIKATIALLQQAMAKRSALKAGIVLSMVLPQSTLNDEVKTMLSEYGVPVHSTMISQRVSYVRSPVTGSVFGSADQRAKTEVTSLASEIIEALQTT